MRRAVLPAPSCRQSPSSSSATTPAAARPRQALRRNGLPWRQRARTLGGLGLGNLEALIVLEEFAKISSAVAFPIFESMVGPVRAIEHFASETLKQRIVPRSARAKWSSRLRCPSPRRGAR